MTSSTRARSVEAGVETFGLPRPMALRIRVSISPRGSFTDILQSSLPARLDQDRDQAVITQHPQRDARHLELAIVSPRTARHLAAVAYAGLRRVARQLGKLELCPEALFHGLALIHDDRLQSRPLWSILI